MGRTRSVLALVVAVSMAIPLARVAPVALAADIATTEAEAMAVTPDTARKVVSDSTASGGQAVQLRSKATLSLSGQFPAVSQISVVAKGQQCLGDPSISVFVDGTQVYKTSITQYVWNVYPIATTIPAGTHTIAVQFTNPLTLVCARTVYIDKLSLVLGGPTDPTDPPANGECVNPPVSATRAFFDDFDGPASSPPDPQAWNYELSGNNTFVNTDRPTNGSLDGNGNLAITARRERIYVPGYGWRNYTSAGVHTLKKIDTCYGMVSARIKMPTGKGMHPSFFLLGSDAEDVGWPAAGEVDIAESANTVSGSALHGTGFDLGARAAFNLAGDWREFWVRWERDKITTGVDGQQTAMWTPTSLPAGATWPFNDHPMFIVLKLGMGGSAGQPDSTTPFPVTMLIDWVRYTPYAPAG